MRFLGMNSKVVVVFLMFLANAAMGQGHTANADTVDLSKFTTMEILVLELKDGSVITGMITEKNRNVSITITTLNGETKEINISQIKQIRRWIDELTKSYSQDETQEALVPLDYRKPHLAAALSFSFGMLGMPMWGQIYNDEAEKALWIFLAEIPAAIIIAYWGTTDVVWETAALTYLGIWGYCIVDAWVSAERINKKMGYTSSLKNSNKRSYSFSVFPTIGEKGTAAMAKFVFNF